ncbi:Response regulator receiver protein [Gammaproteobacteria bacterium]
MSNSETVKKLLIVDDSRVSRMMIRAFILDKHPQWVILESASGDDALVVVGREVPDYCTMDINMPGLNGIDAAALILGKHPSVRIAILTANVQEANQNRATALGARFISKPVTEKSVGQILDFFASAT